MDQPTDATFLLRPASPASVFTRLALLALYVIGGLQWADFFNYGRLNLTAYDWPKERLYFEVIREALRDGRMPWHVEVPAAYVREFPQFANLGREDGTRSRFLALPETVLSPQVLLLRYLNPGRFVLVHFLLLYTVGFAGCLWFRHRYALSLLPFAVLVLLFNFNGYITAHLSVGHVMCGGYFFLPFVALFILEWVENIRLVLPGIKLAAVFLGMFLQGSLHMVVWCWLFLALIVAWNPSGWRSAVWAIGLSGLLAAFRLVPAAVAYWKFKELAFGGGYPTLTTLAEALLVVRDPEYRFAGGIFWWEYDLFVGILGVAVLAYFGVYRRFGGDPRFLSCRYVPLDLPMLLMLFFSLSDFFYPIFNLPLPLVNSERVTSRFIVIPFVMLLFISTIRMQREAGASSLGMRAKLVILIGLVVLWRCLFAHAEVWKVETSEVTPNSRWHELAQATVVAVSDPVYAASLWAGAAISFIASVMWIFAWQRARSPANIA
jgi:hypothetical protein